MSPTVEEVEAYLAARSRWVEDPDREPVDVTWCTTHLQTGSVFQTKCYYAQGLPDEPACVLVDATVCVLEEKELR
jgi:hypothetical protein